MCSSKDGTGIHNGLSAMDSYNGQKISDTVWDKRSVLLSSNHLVLAFDSGKILRMTFSNRSKPVFRTTLSNISYVRYIMLHNVKIIILDQNNAQANGGFNVLWEIYEKDDVADGTKEAFAGFFDDINDVIENVFDGSEYKKENRKDAIPKVRKALKKMTQKVFNKLETQWYRCGTASNGNY